MQGAVSVVTKSKACDTECTVRLSLQHFSVQFYRLRIRTVGDIHYQKQCVIMKQPRVTYDSVGIEVATFSNEKLSVGSGTLYRLAVFFKQFFKVVACV
jgi:hypothetical protein